MSKRKWTAEEIEEYRCTNRHVFYYNKEDSNLWVPRNYGFGLSFNWANPISWICIFAIILLIIIRKFM